MKLIIALKKIYFVYIYYNATTITSSWLTAVVAASTTITDFCSWFSHAPSI